MKQDDRIEKLTKEFIAKAQELGGEGIIIDVAIPNNEQNITRHVGTMIGTGMELIDGILHLFSKLPDGLERFLIPLLFQQIREGDKDEN